MAFELERVLYQTEEFLLRTLRSGSVRKARKRRFKRKIAEAVRRLKRSAFLLVGILAALLAYSIFVAPIGVLTWMVAAPTAMLFAFLALFWPTRRRTGKGAAASMAGLDELAIRAGEGLLDRCDELPGRALPAADAIIARLHELQPHLSALDRNSLLAGDARRLIGEHLSKLVDSYLELPPSTRAPGSESSARITESLGIVAEELNQLLDQCCRDRHDGFETQHRFIESRYRGGEGFRGE